MTKKIDSLQSRVLGAVTANPTGIALKQIQKVLGLDGVDGATRIGNALHDLRRTGHIDRVSRGVYRLAAAAPDPGPSDAAKRMERIVRIRSRRQEPFTVRIVSELAGCSYDWAKRYVSRLIDAGILYRVGYERAGAAKAPSYLVSEEKMNDAWPSTVTKRRAQTAVLDELSARLSGMCYQVIRECRADRVVLDELVGRLENFTAQMAGQMRELLGE